VDQTALLLFAQQRGQGGGEAGGAVAIATMCCQGLIYLAMLAYVVFMYMTMYQALNAVSPRNRDMEPGMIFLMLIPCFGIVWYFFVVIRIASSLEKEFADRGLKEDGDFGRLLGILVIIPCVGFICGVMWLMKLRGYTAQLTGGGKRRAKDDFDEDEDDRPRRKRRDEDDD
jgi:bacteriorhodopsin